MNKNDSSQARKPGRNEVCDDVGNVVGRNRKDGASSDRAPQDWTLDEVPLAAPRDSEDRYAYGSSAGSEDTGRKGRTSIDYPRRGRSDGT